MKPDISKIWPGWEIAEAIGRGSFGSVYKIRRTIRGTTEVAALKVISIPQNENEIHQLRSDGYDDRSITQYFLDSLEKIESEYALMANLKGHSNIVYCDDINAQAHEDGFGWDILIKMELLTPLKKWITAPVTEAQTIKLGMDICNALTLCRQLNIVHRDIKPDNIFVSRDGSFKLGDFGIAKTMEGTRMGTRTGTYDYMAPEVYQGQPYHVQADIYSLGIVLYWMMNGFTTPFLTVGGTKPTPSVKQAACERRFSGDPIPAPLHGSEDLKKIILRSIDADPKKRFQTPEDMHRALQSLNPASAPVPSATADTKQPAAPDADDDRTVLDRKAPGTPVKPEVVHREPDLKTEAVDTGRKASRGKGKKKAGKTGKRKKSPLLLIAAIALAAVVLAGIFLEPILTSPKETLTTLPGDDHYTLTRVGQIEDINWELSFSSDVITRKQTEGREDLVWYTPMGEKYPDDTFLKVEWLGGGVYAAKNSEEILHSLSLLSEDGVELIPPGASRIAWPDYQSAEEWRYLMVYYLGEETNDPDNFLLCLKDDRFYTFDYNHGRLFAGEIRLYDMVEKQFVPNLPAITRNDAVSICGEGILLMDETGSRTLYNSGGMPVMEITNFHSKNGAAFMARKGDSYYVYDGTGAELYVSNQYISFVSGGPYLKKKGGEGEIIMDLTGRELFEAESVARYHDGFFEVIREKRKGLLDADGREVLPCSYDSIHNLGNGLMAAAYGKRYTLITEDGIVATGLEKLPYNLKIEKDGKLYILNSRSYSLPVEDNRTQMMNFGILAKGGKSNGLFGAIDLYSGRELLPCEFAKMHMVADRLYAYRNGMWEIYEVTLHQ